jgi:hypothetical protein
MSSASGDTAVHSCFESCKQDTSALEDNVCIECTSERQGHGKAFETAVVKMIGRDIAKIGGPVAEITLTKHNDRSKQNDNHDFEFSRVDIIDGAIPHPKYSGDGISIKMIKNDCTVCMGKAVSISNNFEVPWSILVAFYVDVIKGGITCKCIKQVFLLHLKPENRSLFFGNCSTREITDLDNVMHDYEVDKSSKEKTDESLEDLRNIVKPIKVILEEKIKEGGGYVSLAQKISKSNKRLQCTINKRPFASLLTKLRPLGQVIEIEEREYPDLFKPIVPKESRGGRKQKTKNRRKKRRIKKTLKVSNRKRR